MDTKAAAEVLRVNHETLLELARLGLVGRQEFEGEPWEFTPAEVASLLKSVRTLKASFREAAELHCLNALVLRLQRESTEAIVDTEFAGLQVKALELAKKLLGSDHIEVQRSVRHLVRQAGGGAARVLQTA